MSISVDGAVRAVATLSLVVVVIVDFMMVLVALVVVSVMGTSSVPSLMRPASASVFTWSVVLLVASSSSIGSIHVVATLSVLLILLILSKLLVLSKLLLILSVLSKPIATLSSSILLILIKASLPILPILPISPLPIPPLPSILLTRSIILLLWLAVIAILCKLNIVLATVLAVLFIVTLSLHCLLN